MRLETPTLTTRRLRLRPFEDADTDALWALHSDREVLRFWDSPAWTDRSRAVDFLATCRRLAQDGHGARVAVERLDSGAFVGWVGLSRWVPTYRSAALGHVYGRDAWGHGFATEAATALLDWGFATLGLHRVQAETDTRNDASVRVLEKLGFVREGTLREDCVVDGEVSSSHVYGLLEGDRPAVGGEASQRAARCTLERRTP